MLEIKNLNFSYQKDKPVLSDISFSVQSGEILGIVGPNGTGKTTLLKSINKLLSPQSGQTLLNGQDIMQLSIKETAKMIAYVPQYTSSFFPMKVIDCVMMGRLPYSQSKYTQKDKEIVFSILQKTDLEEFAFRSIKQMSGGERQRVFIARAMAQQPKTILLDEPTSSLDLKNQLFILHTISQLAKQENYSIIMTIHDLNLASMFCDKVLMLKNSRIFAYGDTQDIFTKENIDTMYSVKTAVTTEDGYKHIRLLK